MVFEKKRNCRVGPARFLVFLFNALAERHFGGTRTRMTGRNISLNVKNHDDHKYQKIKYRKPTDNDLQAERRRIERKNPYQLRCGRTLEIGLLLCFALIAIYTRPIEISTHLFE